tara:strand:- start:441 stop:827 length:387 start_codon:yes stop_codon:yes gene_type:complete
MGTFNQGDSMSDIENRRPGASAQSDTVKLVYLLNFASFIVGITALIGVVIAYLKRGDADALAASHYTFQIRTFWMSVLYVAIGTITSFLLIGFLILFAWLIWAIIRNVKGFIAIGEGRAMDDVNTWLW